MPAGTDRRTSPFRTASGSSSSPPSPELQPAEHLWAFVDEPLVNRYFETIEDLDKAVAERCLALMQQTEIISASTLFHWWPRPRKHQ